MKNSNSLLMFLSAAISKVLDIPITKLTGETNLDSFHLSSLLMMEIIDELSIKFGDLPATLLYEYQTLAALQDYFLEFHPTTVNTFFPNEDQYAETPQDVTKDDDHVMENDIAIIGLSLRFPGANNVAEFWQLLVNQKSAISEVPIDRWNVANYYNPDRPELSVTNTKWGGFITDADKFDPQHFNISPNDAVKLDPQERLFLLTAYAALEDAAYLNLSAEKRDVGVYVGVSNASYGWLESEEIWRKIRHVNVASAYWSVANRVSYAFDFHGPSMAIDTACSSSLTAIHLACESLQQKNCSLAIAGGVNLILHPRQFAELSDLKMLSDDDKTKTFSDLADGFVYGEGVAAVVLKRYQQAIEDNDRIYAIIKASALNAGGKTSGFTVPNPNAQADLIKQVINKSKIDPATISYVEAHGTGTKLGDPIELRGLSKAYQTYCNKKQWCAIGSVKPNIGHLEAAAGIAGLIKIILQMQNQQLVPSINASPLNQKIDFNNSPFYVLQEEKHWKITNEIPLRAALSSFGAGGANAHLIIESSKQHESDQQNHSEYLITLSASHPTSLQQLVVNLLHFLRKNKSEINLYDVAYVLNCGRKHYEHRLAFITKSCDNLIEQLESASKPKTKQLNTSNEELLKYATDYLAQLNNGEFSIYQRSLAKVISLPAYPFLQERYWITDLFDKQTKHHPFLGERVEDGFLKLFHQNDYSYADHVLDQQKIFPGVAHLEMARAAAKSFFNLDYEPCLKNIVWSAPLDIKQDTVTAKIVFKKTEDRHFYEIFKLQDQKKYSLCSQGEVILTQVSARNDLSLTELPDSDSVMDEETIYQKFRSLGWYHGPAFQSLKWIKFSTNKCLAYCEMPSCFIQSNDDYVLNPGIMDGALQAVTILLWRVQQNEQVSLPFSLQEITVVKPIPSKVFVMVTLVKTQAKLKYFDILLSDVLGNPIVIIKGFAMAQKKTLPGITEDTLQYYHTTESKISFDTYDKQKKPTHFILFLPDNYSAESVHQQLALQHAIEQCTIVYIGNDYKQLDGNQVQINPQASADYDLLLNSIKVFENTQLQFVYCWGQSSRVEFDFIQNVELEFYSLVRLTKAIIRKNLKNVQLDYVSHTDAGALSCIEMVAAFLKTVKKEHVSLNCHVLNLETNLNLQTLLSSMHLLKNHPDIPLELKQRGKEFYTQTISPSTIFTEQAVLRQGGTYLVAGGFGGLGKIVCDWLIEQYDANLIIIGRSNFQAVEDLLEKYSKRKNQVLYKQADISNFVELQHCFAELKEQRIIIHGVFHLAGVLNDSLLIDKALTDFEATFSPKCLGTLNLDLLTKDDPLDCFILFSGLAHVVGNVGQSDYASANAFQQHFANWRNQLSASNLRHGKAIAINWPYWHSDGMQVSTSQMEWFYDNWGMRPLPAEIGLQALHKALHTTDSAITPFYGNQSRFVDFITQSPIKNKTMSEASQDDNLEHELASMAAQLIGLTDRKIDINKELTAYGFDSISFIDLSNAINKRFLVHTTPATFFEFTTIRLLALYFYESYSDKFSQKNEPKQVDNKPIVYSTRVDEEIAIIGISGILPQSADVEQFWSNLLLEKSLISEIPADRWDWRRYIGNKQVGDFTNVKFGGFIDEIAKFDAAFFGISPREAELMDPQQRIFLQTVWHAIEDAGYSPSEISQKKTGLYVGVSLFEYGKLLQEHAAIDAYTASGTVHSIVANRVSYFLNLTGPSIALDTACSSSLVAIHEAIKAIRYGDCELAIAGGVNALLEPSFFIAFDKAGMLSEDGTSKTFDANANGYARGEGVGVLVLKPLSKALEDRDSIYGIIKGSNINHGGHATTLTAPNPKAQAQLLIEAYQRANCPINTVGYIECHGTGTSLGDPIEVNGLKKAYQELIEIDSAPIENFRCGIGSLKSTIGHLESAAGVAGVIKVLLMMKFKLLLKNLHFNTLNPYIDLSRTPFYVVNKTESWQRLRDNTGKEYPYRAGVSSFGFGGANAHIILEEAPVVVKQQAVKPAYLFTFSAKQITSLREYCHRFETWLKGCADDVLLQDISYTLNKGRQHFMCRFAVIAADKNELLSKIDAAMDNKQAQTITEQTEFAEIPEWQMGKDNDYIQQLQSLADNYEKGLLINWDLLYANEIVHRIQLPGYRFQKKHFWIPYKQLSSNSTRSSKSFSTLVKWQSENANLLFNDQKNSTKVIAIFARRKQDGLIKQIVKENPKNIVRIIYCAEETRFDENSTWSVDSSDAISFIHCVSRLENIDSIYFLSALNTEPLPLNNESTLHERQSQGIYAFFYLIKALIHCRLDRKSIAFKLITNNVYAVKSSDLLLGSGGEMAGFCLALAKEYPNWNILLVDVLATELMNEIMFSQLLNSLAKTVQYSGEPLCWRAHDGYFRRILHPLELDNSPSVIKTQGVYLVIGGAGGIGLALNHYLRTQYGATVLLVGRSSLSEDKQALVAMHNEQGASFYSKVDITNGKELSKYIVDTSQQYGKIDGVFHCAMVLKDKSLELMTASMMFNVIKPKTQGTQYLLAALANLQLDFIAIFSSMESMMGLAGQSNYAAASTGQDSLANYFSREKMPIKIINWGYWQSAGVVATLQYKNRLENDGIYGIENAEAFSVMEAILANNYCQVAVMNLNEQAKDKLLSLQLHLPESNNKFLESKSGPAVYYEVLNEFGGKLLLYVLQQRSLFIDSNMRYSKNQIIEKLALQDNYQQFITSCLQQLVKQNLLVKDVKDNFYKATSTPKYSQEQLLKAKQQLENEYSDIVVYIQALWEIITKYPEILSGNLTPFEIFNEKNNSGLLVNLYRNNAIVSPSNYMLAAEFQAKLNNLKHKHELRICEVGAGTGGTTQLLLPLLAQLSNVKIEYYFTDLSKAFINDARVEFEKDYPFVHFYEFDINSESIADSWKTHFDFVIGSNVLHATRDINRTLKNVVDLLQDNGYILLNEATMAEDFLTYIFGIFKGWWLYQDQHFRIENSPLITNEVWRQLLTLSQFEMVESIQAHSEELHHVIVAKKTKTIGVPVSQTQVIDKICELLSKILKLPRDEINEEMSFSNIGLDSITGVSFINAINEIFLTEFRVTAIFDYPSIQKLSLKLVAQSSQETVSSYGNHLLFSGSDHD